MVDDFDSLLLQAIHTGDGIYYWHDGHLIPVNETKETVTKDIPDDEIPFCDLDCSECDLCQEECFDCEFEEEEPMMWGIPDVDRIIFNPPATIVFWDDGTKTVVKCMEDQPYEKYAGFAMACMKKMFGSTSRAKAIMNECDVSPDSTPKKSEPQPKHIEVGLVDLCDAIAGAIADATKSLVKEKEQTDETPAE